MTYFTPLRQSPASSAIPLLASRSFFREQLSPSSRQATDWKDRISLTPKHLNLASVRDADGQIDSLIETLEREPHQLESIQLSPHLSKESIEKLLTLVKKTHPVLPGLTGLNNRLFFGEQWEILEPNTEALELLEGQIQTPEMRIARYKVHDIPLEDEKWFDRTVEHIERLPKTFSPNLILSASRIVKFPLSTPAFLSLKSKAGKVVLLAYDTPTLLQKLAERGVYPLHSDLSKKE
ncbi:MAG: hypothetical protein HYZ48_03785 [Chlamydiales bacterium]|nr:hypothetical protein [Chlamydiales bacterium]